MNKKDLQKAQNIIDALFYDDKALTQWQHTLLESVISIAQTKLHQPPVSGRSELLLAFWDWYCKEDNVDNKYTADEMINAFLASNSH